MLASFMGGASVARAEEILNAAGMPTFSFPDTAARAFAYMWHYSDNLRALYETPELEESVGRPPRRGRDSRCRADRRPHAAHRTRIEAAARILRDSGDANGIGGI